MLGFQCHPSLSKAMALVMLFLCCGSSVVFPVTVHNLSRSVYEFYSYGPLGFVT